MRIFFLPTLCFGMGGFFTSQVQPYQKIKALSDPRAKKRLEDGWCSRGRQFESPIFLITKPWWYDFFDSIIAQHRKIFSKKHIFLAHGDSKPLLGSYVKSSAWTSFLHNRIWHKFSWLCGEIGLPETHFRQRWPASLCRQGVMIATSCLDYNDVK